MRRAIIGTALLLAAASAREGAPQILEPVITRPVSAPAPPRPVSAPAPPPITSSGFTGQWAPTPADWKYPVWPSGCSRFAGEERTACLQFNAQDYGRLARFAAANAALPPAQRDRVVFFGDSITDNWGAPSYGGFFPGRPYVNRGIGGQATSQMLVRFRADVLALKPAVVVILAGTNDIAGNAGPATLEQVQDNLATMAELARAHGIKVVLASLLPVADDTFDPEGLPRIQTRSRPPEKIAALNTWLLAYAKKNGHMYLDYFTTVADVSGRFKSGLTHDGLHPNPAAYALMRPLAEKAIAQALAKKK
jgi:lysophospholipase L1-like esterase